MQQEAYGRLARFIAKIYCIFIGDHCDWRIVKCDNSFNNC